MMNKALIWIGFGLFLCTRRFLRPHCHSEVPADGLPTTRKNSGGLARCRRGPAAFAPPTLPPKAGPTLLGRSARGQQASPPCSLATSRGLGRDKALGRRGHMVRAGGGLIRSAPLIGRVRVFESSARRSLLRWSRSCEMSEAFVSGQTSG